MRGRRANLFAAVGAALFGCAAAPVIDQLPIAGRALDNPPAAARADLDARVNRSGAGKFAVTGSRYAVPDEALGWQPIMTRVANEPAVQRGATRLSLGSDAPTEWLIEVWRTRGRDGFAVAMLAPSGGSRAERLLGYYALRFEDGYQPPERPKDVAG